MEKNIIICGDCIEEMQKMEDNIVDCCITSPPYNFGGGKYEYFDDNKSIKEYYEWSVHVVEQLLRITSANIFWNIQLIANNKIAVLKFLGYFAEYIKDIMVWDKITAEPAIQKNVLNSQFEFIIILNKNDNKRMIKEAPTFWGTIPNIIKIKKASSNKFSDKNAATFVLDLPLFIIKNFTNENDTIIDPFIGTGTTAIAAKQLKRNYIGIDIDKNLVDICNLRLRQGNLF